MRVWHGKLRNAAVVLGCMLLSFFAAPAAQAKVFDYLYIDASEGNASGGHVALRIGDAIYHYQHVDHGLIRVVKNDPADFEFLYRYLHNRSIYLSRIEVTGETYVLLRDHFAQQNLLQKQQFSLLDKLHQERRLLHWLRGDAAYSQPPPLPLKGAGLFFRVEAVDGVQRIEMIDKPEAGALATVRQEIVRRHGDDFLRRRKEKILRQIARLSPVSWDAGALDSAVDSAVPGLYTFSEQYQDLLTALLAVQVLQEARPLLDDALLQLPDAALGLDAVETEHLRQLRRRLRQSLLQLLESSRPDWGYALLTTSARLIAIEKSIASGRLVAVDGFADDSPVLEKKIAVKYRAELQRQRQDALRLLREEKNLLRSRKDFSESDYSYLELAVNRYSELQQGLKYGRAMRLYGAQLLPTRSIALPGMVAPEVTERQIGRTLRQIDDFEARYLELLQQRYRYNLLTRNCVTELFRGMEHALAGSTDADVLSGNRFEQLARQESHRRLGGHVDPQPVNFIPFVSYHAVQNHYHVAESRKLPSYRLGRLEELNGRENAVWVAVREGNTLTSTLYRYNDEDSFFIFFTDDSLLLRPLYGAVNTVVGVAESLLGLLTLPFDSGKILKSGVVGILMSLPELAFFNMRKGTYRFLPEQPLALAGQADDPERH